MRIRCGFAVTLTALTMTLALSLSRADARGGERTAASDAEYRLIDALNDRIQERFRNLVDRRFGYGRVATLDRTPHRFDARSESEAGVISSLERAGLRVVVYVSGRSVLSTNRDGISSSTPPEPSFTRTLVKGPAIVTPALAVSTSNDSPSPPQALELIDESRKALLAFTEVEATEFTRPGWKFIARPVWASDDACFSCHRDKSAASTSSEVRFEPLLGVVLYGYRQLD